MNDAARDSLLSDTGGPSTPPSKDEDRRSFMRKAWSIGIGSILGLFPLVCGLIVFFDPLRPRRRTAGKKIKVATLAAVPADGIPRLFTVIADKVDDAWNRYLNVPVGAVYLVRLEEKPNEVVALNTTCPHLGCFVQVKSGVGYYCPCHKSEFRLPLGELADAEHSPAPRALDTLRAEIDGNDILVEFRNFKTGTEEKIPV